MKVKELITILQACNPESDVYCRWLGDKQRDIEFRQACSWLVENEETPVGTGTDALQSFSILGAELGDAIVQGLDGLECTLSIDQDYFVDTHVVDTIKELKMRKDAK